MGSRDMWANSNPKIVAYNCCIVQATYGTVQLTCRAHPAEQGTQKSDGNHPQQHAGHSANASAGHDECRCGAPAQFGRLRAHPEAQQDMHSLSTKRLHKQGPWPHKQMR